ncbi:hypothetical protein PR048_000878 [Dryococelus australis]|uniref:Uncharacterized protein n=1 Tax=Dryococelus australis TaxID=614101 RepID=A0ABQ9IFV3_9NEOP|nr:hypothetical protein PR048_000878 [Dryococelus australis]
MFSISTSRALRLGAVQGGALTSLWTRIWKEPGSVFRNRSTQILLWFREAGYVRKLDNRATRGKVDGAPNCTSFGPFRLRSQIVLQCKQWKRGRDVLLHDGPVLDDLEDHSEGETFDCQAGSSRVISFLVHHPMPLSPPEEFPEANLRSRQHFSLHTCAYLFPEVTSKVLSELQVKCASTQLAVVSAGNGEVCYGLATYCLWRRIMIFCLGTDDHRARGPENRRLRATLPHDNSHARQYLGTFPSMKLPDEVLRLLYLNYVGGGRNTVLMKRYWIGSRGVKIQRRKLPTEGVRSSTVRALCDGSQGGARAGHPWGCVMTPCTAGAEHWEGAKHAGGAGNVFTAKSGYLEPCYLQCIPQLLKGARRRRQTANTTIEVVLQMFNWIEIGAVRGPGKNFEILIVFFQPRADTSSRVARSIIVLENPILRKKDNHYVRQWMQGVDSLTLLAGHADVHPSCVAENMTRRRRLPFTNQQRSSRHTVKKILVVFFDARVLAWVQLPSVYSGAPFVEGFGEGYGGKHVSPKWQGHFRLKTPVYLEIFSAFEAEWRGNVKGDTTSPIKSPIAAKRKALNWRAVFSSCCVNLRDFQRRPYYFIGGKCVGRFNACPLTSSSATKAGADGLATSAWARKRGSLTWPAGGGGGGTMAPGRSFRPGRRDSHAEVACCDVTTLPFTLSRPVIDVRVPTQTQRRLRTAGTVRRYEEYLLCRISYSHVHFVPLANKKRRRRDFSSWKLESSERTLIIRADVTSKPSTTANFTTQNYTRLLSDESHSQLSRVDGRVCVWKKPNEYVDPTCQLLACRSYGILSGSVKCENNTSSQWSYDNSRGVYIVLMSTVCSDLFAKNQWPYVCDVLKSTVERRNPTPQNNRLQNIGPFVSSEIAWYNPNTPVRDTNWIGLPTWGRESVTIAKESHHAISQAAVNETHSDSIFITAAETQIYLNIVTCLVNRDYLLRLSPATYSASMIACEIFCCGVYDNNQHLPSRPCNNSITCTFTL